MKEDEKYEEQESGKSVKPRKETAKPTSTGSRKIGFSQ